MTRERLLLLLALIGLAAGAWWLTVNTEWVEVERPRPAQGAARDNPVYAFEQLLRRLGLRVEHHEALPGMPPPQARLVLLSNDWELIPGRAEQLQEWVRRGGHLVLPQVQHWDDTALAKWVPVEVVRPSRPDKPMPSAAARPASAAGPRQPGADDPILLVSTPPPWEGTAKLFSCDMFYDRDTLRPKQGQEAAWTLKRAGAAGNTQVLRVPVGQGSVTVLNTGWFSFHNQSALRCDHPLLLAAAVQAEPGAIVWVYVNEKREALLPWLWQQGWIAIVAGLLALAAALWRAAVRFGPRLAPAPRLRRSISEQVRGLGAYLQGAAPDALLAAQQRALHEAAARALPRYARLATPARAQAVADATGLALPDLSAALTARFCTRAELPQRLQVLETARRRLQKIPDERRT